MSDFNEELARRIAQFASFLEKMHSRSHEEVCGPCFMIFSEESPDSCIDNDELSQALSPALEFSMVAFDGTGFDEDPPDSGSMVFVEQPVESWREDDSRKRFIQFSFERDWFCMDMPIQTLYEAEARQILQSRKGFFYLRERPQFTLNGEDVDGYDPFRKIYLYGDEYSAAEDMAFVFFHIWKFPIDWRFFVKSAAFGKKAEWEWDVPIE